jgi:polyhydroxyalkanoate synthesis regulator phasin
LSSRPLDGNTEKDANKLPRRAVGKVEMIEKAHAIRQAKIAELKKKINTLKEEIRELEATSKGKSPELSIT